MSEAIEHVNKVDAARRQLDSAIRLYFAQGDMVSIHTLSTSAQEILRSLAKRKGIDSGLKDSPFIREDKRTEVIQFFNRAQNFFKHADRDPEEVLEFRPAATPFYIFDAVYLYGQVTGSFFPSAVFFRMWFFVKFPQVTLGPARQFADEAKALGANPDNFPALNSVLQGIG